MPAGAFSITVSQLHAAHVVVVDGERQHHAAADLQVAQQRGRDLRRRGGDDDAVDLEILAQIRRAVAVLDAHVVQLQRAQVAPRLGDQRADALDRVDLVGELRQDRGLVAAAGADLRARGAAARRPATARSCGRRRTAAKSSVRRRSAAGCRRRRGSPALPRRRCAAAPRPSPRAPPRRGCPARAGARPCARACAPKSCRCRRIFRRRRSSRSHAATHHSPTRASSRVMRQVDLQRRHRNVAQLDRVEIGSLARHPAAAPAAPTQ